MLELRFCCHVFGFVWYFIWFVLFLAIWKHPTPFLAIWKPLYHVWPPRRPCLAKWKLANDPTASNVDLAFINPLRPIDQSASRPSPE